jgi:hypothetical protein
MRFAGQAFLSVDRIPVSGEMRDRLAILGNNIIDKSLFFV